MTDGLLELARRRELQGDLAVRDVSRDGEEPVVGTDDRRLYVASDYVWMQGEAHEGIPLDAISSVSIQEEAEDDLLAYAVIAAIAGAVAFTFLDEPGFLWGGLAVAAILTVIWYLSRSAQLSIESPTAEISLDVESKAPAPAYDTVRLIREKMRAAEDDAKQVAVGGTPEA